MELCVEGKIFVNGVFQDCCIGIDDGKITSIKKILKGDKNIKFNHKIILPAGVDIHVHFREPGMIHKEDFSSGSLAAAFGGISCFFDMPNTIPSTLDINSLIDKRNIADNKSYIDFGLYVGITNDNYDKIKNLGSFCNGFKLYLGNTTNSLILDSDKLIEIFDDLSGQNKTFFIHAEDNKCLLNYNTKENNLADHCKFRPSECEETSIKKIIKTCQNKDVKIHICHISSTEGIKLLENKAKNITCGVTPHHLLFNLNMKMENEALLKVNPPIRRESDRLELMKNIMNGVIDLIESDHAPHTLEEKTVEFDKAPSGIPGVETIFPIFLYLAKNDFISYQRLISMFCSKPSEILNIRKGKIEVGMDADFIVVDTRQEIKIKSENLHSKCGWSPFEGCKAIFPSHLFVRGEKLIEDFHLIGRQGFGNFVGEK